MIKTIEHERLLDLVNYDPITGVFCLFKRQTGSTQVQSIHKRGDKMNIKTWQERIVTANPPYVDPEEINKAMLEEIEELREAFTNLHSDYDIIETDREELQAKLAESEKCLQDSIDCNLDKLLAMTDEQVTALTRLDGSNPDDVAALARKAMQCAVLTVERDELRADLDAERDAAELKSACITGMRQEVTAWSMTVENLEAERDALKALNLKLAIGVVALAYEADALFSVDEVRELMNPFESQLNSIFAGEPSFEDQVCNILKEANHD